MKPFDLEAAKRGEPICTRDGRPAKFIAHVPGSAREDQKILVLVDGDIYAHCEDGTFHEERHKSGKDLFMAPRKKTLWFNLFIPHTNKVEPYTEFVGEREKIEPDQNTQESKWFIKTFSVEVEE